MGVLPPTIHGQSIVTAQVLSILRENNFNVKVVRIFDLGNKSTLFVKCFYLMKTLVIFLRYVLPSNQIVYLPAANSLFGNLRNAPFILFSSLFGHKVVIHFHTGDFNLFFQKQHLLIQKFIKWVFSFVDSMVILGESVKNNFSCIAHKDLNVVSIVNSISLTDSMKIEKKSFNNSNEIRIIYMSNLIRSKGYFDLLLAVDLLVNNYGLKNIKCDFCGNFLDKESKSARLQFEKFVVNKRLENVVKLNGLVTGELKNQLINNSDFFVLPTYYETEAMPISILEAMKAGVVVVTTKYRAIPEIILDNQTGCFVDRNRPDQIADKIIELIKNENRFNSIRLNGFEHLRSNFSEEIFSKRVLGLFQSFQ